MQGGIYFYILSMINTLFWNIRGIGKKVAVSRLKLLKKNHQLQLISICEPKLHASKITNIQLKLGYDQAFQNQSNRIWIFFDNHLKGKIIHESEQHISVQLSHPYFKSDILAVFIHAYCSIEARKTLWDSLASFNCTNMPCIFYGDFNVILSEDEKKGGLPFQAHDALD